MGKGALFIQGLQVSCICVIKPSLEVVILMHNLQPIYPASSVRGVQTPLGVALKYSTHHVAAHSYR